MSDLLCPLNFLHLAASTSSAYSLMLSGGDVHATAVVPYDSIVLHSIELTPQAQLPNITISLQACLLHQQSARASSSSSSSTA
jgi:hypothetical protein